MQLLIATCHKRAAPATTGMVPFSFTNSTSDESWQANTQKAYQVFNMSHHKFLNAVMIKVLFRQKSSMPT